jgi:hypothetical protein
MLSTLTRPPPQKKNPLKQKGRGVALGADSTKMGRGPFCADSSPLTVTSYHPLTVFSSCFKRGLNGEKEKVWQADIREVQD